MIASVTYDGTGTAGWVTSPGFLVIDVTLPTAISTNFDVVWEVEEPESPNIPAPPPPIEEKTESVGTAPADPEPAEVRCRDPPASHGSGPAARLGACRQTPHFF